MKRAIVGAMLLALVAGCGDGKARLTGRVVQNGENMTFPPNSAAIEVTPVSPGGERDLTNAFTAVVNEDGTFEVLASGGQVPPGQYEIAFRGYGSFAAKYRSYPPFRQEVKAGKNEVTIDLAKPQR